MWGLEYSYNFTESVPEIAQSAGFFNKLSEQLANEQKP
jgi:hypothetical protein